MRTSERNTDREAAVRAMAGALVEVVETMFFELPLDEVREGLPPAEGRAAWTAFGGTHAGWLEVRLEEGAARRLAANFLGREDEWTVTEPEIELVALELANILCGNALSRLDPGGRFRIEAPRLERRSEEGGPWLAAPLESGRVALRAGFEAQS